MSEKNSDLLEEQLRNILQIVKKIIKINDFILYLLNRF